MTAPPPDGDVPPAVRSVVRELDRHWRRLGVPRALRDAVAADVGADLHAAHREGRTPAAVLGMPVERFAGQVARENGWLVPWPMYGRVLTSAALGAAAAIVAGFVLVLPAIYLLSGAAGHVYTRFSPGTAVYGESTLSAVVPCAGYAAFGVGFVAAVLAAVRRGLAAAVGLRATLRAGAVLLPVSAAVSLPSAVAVGHASGYSDAPAVVATEFGLVLGLAGVALVAARAWALRPSREPVSGTR